jgi:hypothetical protein
MSLPGFCRSSATVAELRQNSGSSCVKCYGRDVIGFCGKLLVLSVMADVIPL